VSLNHDRDYIVKSHKFHTKNTISLCNKYVCCIEIHHYVVLYNKH